MLIQKPARLMVTYATYNFFIYIQVIISTAPDGTKQNVKLTTVEHL